MLIGALTALQPTASAATITYEEHVLPRIEQHCGACHGVEKQEAGIRLTGYPDFRSARAESETWRRVFDELDFETMPPSPHETGFTDQDRTLLMDWIESAIIDIDPEDPIYQNPGPPKLRLLTFSEYERTLKSLLGITVDVEELLGLVDEPPIKGFTNRADGRQMDPVLFNKYLDGAEVILRQFFWVESESGQQPIGGKDAEKEAKKAREQFFYLEPGKDGTEEEVVGRLLFRFVARAYRREPQPRDITPLVQLFSALRKNGDDYETAVRKILKPVLASPHFLYRVEQDRLEAGSEPYPVGNFELATRLSYFLWGTMPDEELFAVAAQGKLTNPQTLRDQTTRMLKDEKARALTDLFAAQWLQLHHLHIALPTESTFPSYTNKLKNDLEEETLRFFDELRLQDRSVLDLLDSDYTYLNERLAEFYGIDGVKGDEFREVSLKPSDNRGGLLGMGSILSMTSHTDRTVPTARGKWVLDVIVGTPPPPPPPEAGNFVMPEGAKEPETFRDKLELHSQMPSCAGCHAKLDPIGFALDEFNAVGQWRSEEDRKLLDTSGKLPSGQVIRGMEDLRAVLKQEQDRFTENLVSQMLSYAIGRYTEYYDQLTIHQITQSLKRENYRFSVLIEQIVLSRPFLYRRNSTVDDFVWNSAEPAPQP